MPLNSDIKFQKALALAASASNSFEAEAAELAARRLMTTFNIDPTDIPNQSLYSHMYFTDNALLRKLRDEWREAHPPPIVVTKENKCSELKDLLTIPFNMDGFIKHAYRKKGKNNRKKQVILTDDECEKIRLLFNEGWGLKDVAELTDLSSETINSARAYRIRKHIWLRDGDGKFQWAGPVSKPCVTQPTGESPR